MRFLETEQVRLLILNGRHSIANNLVISNGSFNAAMASPREVFYYALKHKAVAIILLHNHPSGDPSPSREDLVLTRRIAQTGELIGIPLLDHIIIGDNRYVSVKESGYFSLAQDTK
jgi:DNA repair protein RadC